LFYNEKTTYLDTHFLYLAYALLFLGVVVVVVAG
jgi:hypothetical protein